jgi:hypothetical protein
VVNVGVGFVSGNTLSVGYVGASPGVVVYRLDADRLTGEWTDIGSSGHVYKETLTRLADGEKITPEKGGPLFYQPSLAQAEREHVRKMRGVGIVHAPHFDFVLGAFGRPA